MSETQITTLWSNTKDSPMYRPIKGFEGRYSVSWFGAVASYVNGEKILRPVFTGPYLYVILTDGKGGQIRQAIHRLVAGAWCPKKPEHTEVNHIDCVKTNNTAGNLEWVTRSQNLFHAANNGLKPVGAKSHLAKLTEDDVREIRRRRAAGETQRAIAAEFGVSQTCISKIITNKKWKQLAA